MPYKMSLYRELRTAGLSRRRIRNALTRNVVARPCRGVYTQDDDGDRFRDLRALFLRLPPGAVAAYATAAAIYGFGSADSSAAVHVVVPRGIARPRIQGVVCHEALLPVGPPIVVAGVPLAPPARCAIDLARTTARPAGLATLDAALRRACTPSDLVAEVGRHAGLRGVRRARELVGLADGRAECAQESHLRLVIIDGGLPAPEPQLWVHDSTGRRAYRIDLGYRERKVGLEYDGRSHLTPARLSADRSRMNGLSRRGWTMRHFTARDLYQSPGVILAEVRALLA
jgi:hypothetical protein